MAAREFLWRLEISLDLPAAVLRSCVNCFQWSAEDAPDHVLINKIAGQNLTIASKGTEPILCTFDAGNDQSWI